MKRSLRTLPGNCAIPKTFLSRVRELYSDPNAKTDDLLEFVDGRFYERHSEPQRIHGRTVGRVWVSAT